MANLSFSNESSSVDKEFKTAFNHLNKIVEGKLESHSFKILIEYGEEVYDCFSQLSFSDIELQTTKRHAKRKRRGGKIPIDIAFEYGIDIYRLEVFEDGWCHVYDNLDPHGNLETKKVIKDVFMKLFKDYNFHPDALKVHDKIEGLCESGWLCNKDTLKESIHKYNNPVEPDYE